ncbi:hypothetical protein [Fuerstiella marisgermanici]|nr:hypothetical protein [Fuerstiella marisgermanici]
MRAVRLLVVLMLMSATAVLRADERQSVIVVVGAEGTPEYRQMFSEWTDRWQAAAKAGDADFAAVGRGQSDESSNDLQTLQTKVTDAISVKTDEPLWLVLIGHGTFDGRVARFNLRGPDLSADAAAELLATSQRPVAVINCASCSAPFISALSAPNRIVITGTKDGNQVQFTRFGGFLADAIANLDADIDRDGQTSLLEACLFSARRVEEYYKSDGRLATEHSLLDDNGDGKGVRAELFEGVRVRENVKDKTAVDGKLAKRWHLVRSEAERSLSPEHRMERDRLEEQLEQLRPLKAELSEAEYLGRLEDILLPLARLYETSADPPQANQQQPQ